LSKHTHFYAFWRKTKNWITLLCYYRKNWKICHQKSQLQFIIFWKVTGSLQFKCWFDWIHIICMVKCFLQFGTTILSEVVDSSFWIGNFPRNHRDNASFSSRIPNSVTSSVLENLSNTEKNTITQNCLILDKSFYASS
jgi:hypothetical protein